MIRIDIYFLFFMVFMLRFYIDMKYSIDLLYWQYSYSILIWLNSINSLAKPKKPYSFPGTHENMFQKNNNGIVQI